MRGGNKRIARRSSGSHRSVQAIDSGEAGRCRRMHGGALVEWLVAAPLAILVGLFVAQWALIWEARHAIDYATQRAARAAALEHGAATAIEKGLADGMGPFWHVDGATLGRAQVLAGLAAGWLGWERTWPPPQAFQDFAEPALDAFGEPIAGVWEVPNDNLRFRPETPGPQSKISIQDANRLGVRTVYGVPLVVPVVNQLAVRTMQALDGCEGETRFVFGLLSLGTSSQRHDDRNWACAIYRAPDRPGGAPRWRWPVRVASEVRMHSTWRESDRRRGAATGVAPNQGWTLTPN